MEAGVVKALKRVLGEDRVLLDEEKLEPYQLATIPVDRKIPGALKPRTVAEVQEVVRIANAHRIPLYPISTGRNWGYGSANPVRDDSLILDLGDMNRIVEVNTELAYAVIEPGVSQQQLYEHLERHRTGLMMDPTGSGPACSVLGNTLERGYGITAYGDHFEALCGMEVVLADGSVLRTGFGHYDQATATHLFKYGVGPYLDGIFTQSNFGIVTKIGLWLMPVPESFEAGYFFCRSEADLGPVIDVTRGLLLNRVVKGSINLLHRNRSLTVLTQYPWHRMRGRTPLDEKTWQELGAEKGVGIWNGVVALYGTREEIRAAKRIIKRRLRPHVAKLQFVSNRLLRLLERFQRPLGLLLGMNLSELLKALKPSYELMKGKPGEVSLPTPYWRMKKPVPDANIDPARDNCGLYWFAPVIPMTRHHVRTFIQTVEPIFDRHGFEPCITLTTVTHRAFDCTLPILYNKEDPEETERASACYRDVLKACMKAGYIPYRFGIQSMEELAGREDRFWEVVETIKNALDPNGIIAPGRYCR
ncbi:MAG: FAD-binding oxidoreductase [Deltaproteobacteria bacterium]|nr:FAD-binding oxidoreductase [Deltaproteobacteria bacterium]